MTQELRRLAEACKQDSAEWKWDGRTVDSDGYVHIPECSYLIGNICLSDTYEGYQDHCDFIAAANPAAILSLLDRLEAAEKDAARCKRFIDEVCEETFDTWTNGYRMQQVAMNIKAAMEASK